MTESLRDIAVPDRQVETAEGDLVGAGIDGLELRKPVQHVDHRGNVFEIYDADPAKFPDPVVWVYQTSVTPGVIKGWFVHDVKVDRYSLASGQLLACFYDDRPESPTRGNTVHAMMDVRGIRQIIIPNGVWHLIANLGSVDAELINLPTQPYHRENPDRRGLPWDTDKIPLDVRSLLPANWPR